MKRYKFLWNVIKYSKRENLKYKSNGVLYEIDPESKIYQPLKFLAYDLQRYSMSAYLLIFLSLGIEGFFIPFLITFFSVYIIIYLILPLVMIPKDFNKYLPVNDF